MLNPEATIESVIPHGLYCYQHHGEEFILCPFWSRVKNKPEQEDGYCSLLKRGDWEDGMTHLWDQVKECGINEGLDS